MNVNSPAKDQLSEAGKQLSTSPWLIACLCAAWCDTCQIYRKSFEAIRTAHPNKSFAWVDIEDHADLVDDLDIENFPTILIEYKSQVIFLGTMLPDATLISKLLISFEQTIQEKSAKAIQPSIQASNLGLPTNWSLSQQLKDTSKTQSLEQTKRA